MQTEQIKKLLEQAKTKQGEHKKTYTKLRKVKPKALDAAFHEAHTQTFACIDCLDCANCCTTTGPLFTTQDIDRLSKHLKLKANTFIDKYLRIDEDGDFVLKSVPCPFLGDDNYCGVYEARPKACREYPHTNRNKMHQILNLTKKNASVCPAVFLITEKVKQTVL